MKSAAVYDWRGQAVIGGLVNLILNGALGYLLFGEAPLLPLWGFPSVSFDLVGMTFGIAFGTGVGVTAQVRARQRAGRLTQPVIASHWLAGFSRWPATILHRSINLGALGVLLFSPIPFAALLLWFPEGMPQAEFVAFKSLLGFVEGAVVTPIIGLAAFESQADSEMV